MLTRKVAGLLAAVVAVIAGHAFAAGPEGPALEVSTAALPRFDGIDGVTQSSRVGITLMPQRRSGVGLAFGVTSISSATPAFGPPNVAASSVDFGVHWRYTFDSNYRFDVTAYRRTPNSDAISLIESHDPEYGARIEMGFGSMGQGRGKGFVADRGFVGLQLESGARLAIKRKNGGPMLYYRNTF